MMNRMTTRLGRVLFAMSFAGLGILSLTFRRGFRTAPGSRI